MNTTGIRVLDKKDGIVSVELSDIFEEIQHGAQFHWSILFFYGTGQLQDGKSIPVFVEEIKKSERGLLLTWGALNSLASTLWDVEDITIIGCKDPQKIFRYVDDKDMYESCDIVIEMIDSSYWEIFSKDEGLIHRLTAKFKDVKFITDLDFMKPNHPNPHQHNYEKNSTEGTRKRGPAEPLAGWEY